ncbi:MAG: NAD(P)H-dependent glycerol-3-phosphate dehydrogenase [Halobacteriovoraceae bacterium]|nr:NAD(P)H-dependent glycerol-3-phosphate dehydrogenase [Halobacteriovoraceae bacterium]
MNYNTAIIVGGGAFGTSLAAVLANNFKHVFIKVRSVDVRDGINSGENTVYLPGHKLSKNIKSFLEWKDLDHLIKFDDIEVIVNGLPSSAIRKYYLENFEIIEKHLKKDLPFVSLTKGIDADTLEMSDDILFEIFPRFKENFVFLSGPSFAHEIVNEHITMVSLAGMSKSILEKSGKMLETSFFKIMFTYDIKGVLLGGALKNILAIGGGIIEGMGHNHNTKAAMVTRGIAEMLRFGHVYNARPETFYGLSGMGDLILTTTGDLSRNKQFGLEIAKGRSPSDIIQSSRSVVEGYKTAKAAYLITKKFDIRARIFTGIYSILHQNVKPKDVLLELMRVPSRFEIIFQ